jgi:hypothetical protein
MYFKLEGSFGSVPGNCEATYYNGTNDIVLDSSWQSKYHWGKEGKF